MRLEATMDIEEAMEHRGHRCRIFDGSVVPGLSVA
jgi:hypothetical protein